MTANATEAATEKRVRNFNAFPPYNTSTRYSDNCIGHLLNVKIRVEINKPANRSLRGEVNGLTWQAF
jgi:hypothetical protein